MKKWTKEKIEKAIQNFIKQHGRYPTTKEMDSRSDLPSRSIFPIHFGKTYSEWRKERDNNYSFMDSKFREMNEADLKKWLKNRLIEIGTTQLYEYEKSRKRLEPSATFWKKRYKWNELMIELGLKEEVYYSKKETIQEFRKIYSGIGHTPSVTELRKFDNKLLHSIIKHFDKYNDFLNLMNVDIVRNYEHVNKSDDDLINDYLDLCNELQKLATLREINECEWTVSSDTYLQRFGSIQKVRKLAGLDQGKRGKRYYSREMLDRKIKRIVDEHGKDISVKEFYFRVGCAKATLAKYYGTTSVRKIINEVIKDEHRRN